MLTLAEAIKTNRLREFVAQEEKRGIGPINKKELPNRQFSKVFFRHGEPLFVAILPLDYTCVKGIIPFLWASPSSSQLCAIAVNEQELL